MVVVQNQEPTMAQLVEPANLLALLLGEASESDCSDSSLERRVVSAHVAPPVKVAH